MYRWRLNLQEQLSLIIFKQRQRAIKDILSLDIFRDLIVKFSRSRPQYIRTNRISKADSTSQQETFITANSPVNITRYVGTKQAKKKADKMLYAISSFAISYYHHRCRKKSIVLYKLPFHCTFPPRVSNEGASLNQLSHSRVRRRRLTPTYIPTPSEAYIVSTIIQHSCLKIKSS